MKKFKLGEKSSDTKKEQNEQKKVLDLIFMMTLLKRWYKELFICYIEVITIFQAWREGFTCICW